METNTPSPVIKPRSVKVASRLSDLCYGLGQIYCGHLARGLVIYVISMTLLTGWIVLIALMKGRFLEAVLIGVAIATALWLFAKFDARRLAAKAPSDYALKEYNRWYVYAMLACLILPVGVCGAFFLRATAYQAYVVTTDRMAPTIRAGQRVLANKTLYDVEPMKRGEVVIVRSPNELRTNLVQRLVGLPGDTVSIEPGGALIRITPSGVRIESNGASLTADRVVVTYPRAAGATQPASAAVERTVPAGRGFFINDNSDPELGRDGMGNLGEAPLSNVVGRVEYIYWPPQLSRVK